MTEKRFELRLSALGNGMITDTEQNRDLFFDKDFLGVTLRKTNDWLNELAEENEQLKSKLENGKCHLCGARLKYGGID